MKPDNVFREAGGRGPNARPKTNWRFWFPIRLKELRGSRMLGQTELAERTGICQSHISKLELAEKQPTLDMVLRLAEFFDCSVDELLGVGARAELKKAAQ